MNRLAYQLFIMLAFSTLSNAGDIFSQNKLPADYGLLQEWRVSIVRIEITDGSTIGTNSAPPKVKLKIIEVIRKGDVPPRKHEYTCEWKNDNTTTSWATRSLAGSFDPNWDNNKRNWEMDKIHSPPTNSRFITFTLFKSNLCHLYRNFTFTDTLSNRLTAINYSASRPLIDISTIYGFWLILTLPTIAAFILTFNQKIAIIISSTTFPVYFLYNSLIPTYSIRLDMIAIYPAMIFAALVIIVGLALWARNIALSEQDQKQG